MDAETIRKRVEDSIELALTNKRFISEIINRAKSLNANPQYKIYDVRLKFQVKGDTTKVGLEIFTEPLNNQLKESGETVIGQVIPAIESYLNKYHELYPQKVNGEQVEYNNFSFYLDIQLPQEGPIMFNTKNTETELAASMESNLISKAIDVKTETLSKLTKAIEHLNTAAELFDAAGLHKEAEYATILLEKVSQVPQRIQPPSVAQPKQDPLADALKTKLMQAIPPEIAAHLTWRSFEVKHDGQNIQLFGEYELPQNAQYAAYKVLPKAPSGKPVLLANYMNDLAKKLDPRISLVQLVHSVPLTYK